LKDSIAEKAEKYISGVERVLRELRIPHSTKDVAKVDEILDTARSYKRDAEHFMKNGDAANGLAAVCYAEGLLDALHFLGLVEFEWPAHHIP